MPALIRHLAISRSPFLAPDSCAAIMKESLFEHHFREPQKAVSPLPAMP
jgi:hypothetical protein